MSVQFGRWNFEGKPIDQADLEKVKPLISPHGLDDSACYSNPDIAILYCAFHTTKESRRETQPQVTESGAVLTWDGRLDNRAELIAQLSETISSTDISIVTAAYHKWGTGCFAKFIGDWALSIWDANSRLLILAKDPIGMRHLYYAVDKDQVTWSTLLDPLVLLARKAVTLCEEYLAGWLSFFPAAHLTPYDGIHSVPPASFVTIQEGKHAIGKYWDFDAGKRIRCRTDGEYEEHFRSAFRTAVKRALRSDSPILAELSGGRDSSSIVCMADTLLVRGSAETPRLDTVSYYNDSEPNWNERPYFTKVEEKRGRTGCHIDVGWDFKLESEGDRFEASPGSLTWRRSETARRLAACMTSQGNCVVLSGIGGDEVTGGVPTTAPELQDLLVAAQFKVLAHQLKAWALNRKKPWFHLFFEAVRGFFSPALVGVPKYKRPAPWLTSGFVKRNRAALEGYETRVKLFGPSPTFQENLSTLEGLQRQISCDPFSSGPPYEKRYPYLDRELLELLFAIPREQLVRPGHSRSLMRRALAGIVPDELLNRKRKAFVVRAPMLAFSTAWPSLIDLSQQMLSSSLGIVDQKCFSEVLQRAYLGAEVSIVGLLRTIAMESWLRNQRDWNALKPSEPQTDKSISRTRRVDRQESSLAS